MALHILTRDTQLLARLRVGRFLRALRPSSDDTIERKAERIPAALPAYKLPAVATFVNCRP